MYLVIAPLHYFVTLWIVLYIRLCGKSVSMHIEVERWTFCGSYWWHQVYFKLNWWDQLSLLSHKCMHVCVCQLLDLCRCCRPLQITASQITHTHTHTRIRIYYIYTYIYTYIYLYIYIHTYIYIYIHIYIYIYHSYCDNLLWHSKLSSHMLLFYAWYLYVSLFFLSFHDYHYYLSSKSGCIDSAAYLIRQPTLNRGKLDSLCMGDRHTHNTGPIHTYQETHRHTYRTAANLFWLTSAKGLHESMIAAEAICYFWGHRPRASRLYYYIVARANGWRSDAHHLRYGCIVK